VAGRSTNTDRLGTFSDAVFAVIITILVLDLKPPGAHTFSALLKLSPVGLSYSVSYIFIAIVWVNHHHLLGHAEVATPRLVVQLRAPFLGVADPVYHRVDRRQQAGCRAGGNVRRDIRSR
jgi:uncharacterized membrane protein